VDCSRWLVGCHLPDCDLRGHTCPRSLHRPAVHRPGMMSAFTPAVWRYIRVVAFDVDGTLYRQRPLRLRMGRDMVLHTVTKCDLNAISVVSAYRRIRERLGAEEVADFERVLIAETAKATSTSPERVHAIVSEWIERRPLRYLRSCLFSGVPQLFAGLQRAGKKIGIFSDY